MVDTSSGVTSGPPPAELTPAELTPAVSPSRRQATRGAAWVTAQSWVARLLGVVVFAVLGHLLTPGQFGVVALANVVVVLTGLVVQRGLGGALVQHPHPTPDQLSSAFFSCLLGGFACTALLAALAPWISQLLKQPGLTLPLQLLSPVFIFNALEVVPAAVLTRQFQFRLLALRGMSGALAGGTVGVGLALLGAGALALVAQATVSAAWSAAVLLLTCGWWPRFHLDRASLAELRAFSLSVFALNVAGQILDQADKLLIGTFMGPAPLGLYTVAQRLQLVLQDTTLTAAGALAFPTFARLKDDRESLQRALLRMCRVVSTIVLPVFGAMMVLAGEVMAIFGSRWDGSIVVVQILSGLAVLGTFTLYDRAVLMAVGRPNRELAIIGAAIPLNVVIFFATYRFGIEWVALGFLVRAIVFYPVRVTIMTRAVGLGIVTFTRQWMAPLLATVLAIGAAMAVRDELGSGVVVQIALYAGVYVGCIALTAPRSLREVIQIGMDLRGPTVPM